MRTTLTIDDHLAADLKKAALESNKSFKELVNETLRAGLRAREKPPGKPYRLRPVSLGLQRTGVDLDKALRLVDALEDEEIARKLELRK